MRALRGVLMCGAGLVAVAAVSGANAAGRAPGDYFRLDLPHAVMSPEPIGPPAQFERFGIQAKDNTNWLPAPPQETAAAPTPPESNAVAPAAPNPVTANAAPTPRPTASAAPVPRPRVAQHHRVNPYEARAAMARPKPRTPITLWPCRSGGICAWRSPPGY